MMLARQLSKRTSNLVFSGRFRHAHGLVIISELYGHSFSSLCLRSIRATFWIMRELGKFVAIIGVIATLVGLAMWGGFVPKWLGRLPGDIRIERGHSAVYFPIVTCIILSILLSLLFSIFRRSPAFERL